LLPGKVWLFFRGGYLAAKCVVKQDDPAAADEVYRREIRSGLQHPPNDRVLLQKTVWGKATEPRPMGAPASGTLKNGVTRPEEKKEKTPWPRMRCGIATEGLPAAAKRNGYNVVVLYQNVGPDALNISVVLFGFPIGPFVSVAGNYRKNPDLSDGVVIQPGLYGARVMPLEDVPTDPMWRIAALRLNASEMCFFAFRLANAAQFESVRAEIRGLWAVCEGAIRVLDIESPEVRP
jgi:hypothetical protein